MSAVCVDSSVGLSNVEELMSVAISLHRDHRRMSDAKHWVGLSELEQGGAGQAWGRCHWACVTGAGRLEGKVSFVKDGEEAGGGEVEASTRVGE